MLGILFIQQRKLEYDLAAQVSTYKFKQQVSGNILVVRVNYYFSALYHVQVEKQG